MPSVIPAYESYLTTSLAAVTIFLTFPFDTLVRNLFEFAAVVEAGSAASNVIDASSFMSLTAERIPRAHSEGSYLAVFILRI